MDNLKAARAFCILEAAKLTANGDFDALGGLLLSKLLKIDHILRILLTFLPEGIEPRSYVGLLNNLKDYSQSSPTPLAKRPNSSPPNDEAILRVRKMRLCRLETSEYPLGDADPFTKFLIHQAYKIDAETGSLNLVAQLLVDFVGHSEIVTTWMVSVLLPQMRLCYEHYPGLGSHMPLTAFGTLSDSHAVKYLLSNVLQSTRVREEGKDGRDIRCLVGPWMYGASPRKRIKLHHQQENILLEDPSSDAKSPETAEMLEDGWNYVNLQLLELETHDFLRAVGVFMEWDGPRDVDYGGWGTELLQGPTTNLDQAQRNYGQTGLALAYNSDRASLEAALASYDILRKVSRLLKFPEPPDLRIFDVQVQDGIPGHLSKEDLHYNNLLQPEHSLTTPTQQSINLLNLFIWSCFKIASLGSPKTINDMAKLSLFATKDEQLAEFRRTLQGLNANKIEAHQWITIRNQILWLNDCRADPQDFKRQELGPFSKIPEEELETHILKTILDGACYEAAGEIYCKKKEPPLTANRTEDTIISSAYHAYDTASNGNRTRGGARKASQIISAFRAYYPSSKQFSRMEALLSATHSMSFYSLSLQEGVPFQPVNIRAHGDPIALIGQILLQNPKSYTHLDDLLSIGQHLVNAGIILQETGTTPDAGRALEPRQALDVQRRISRMAIEAALAEDDFDTAYSYVVNRLSPPRQNALGEKLPDDISWRAAYSTGRYLTSGPGNSTIRRLEQRMEVLSQALLLAPTPALSDVLTTWQQCEEQMVELLARETVEEDDWDAKGDQRIPGDYATDSDVILKGTRDPTRGVRLEEAPMGLFEVARGAAAALSKNTFPLKGSPETGSLPKSWDRTGSYHNAEDPDSAGMTDGTDGTARVRKRDMVSNMVTGGLVSGIGWVIGEFGSIRVVDCC